MFKKWLGTAATRTTVQLQTIGSVPSYDDVLTELIEAEHAEGWLAHCVDRGVFLAPTDELIAALHAVLSSIGAGPLVEVCAGDGSLSRALRRAGSAVIASDANPPPGARDRVRPIAADEALQRLRPRVVIGSFVPVDAGVNEQVITDPEVTHYLILNVRLPGNGGMLRSIPGWSAEPLDDVARWMITRHDFYVDANRPIVAHGEAWLLRRNRQPS